MSDTLVLVDQNERGRIGKWKPKKWRVEYDRVVAMSVAGISNTEIATKVGFTKEYVSLILNLDEGKALYNRLQAKILEDWETQIPNNLNTIARKTTERLLQAVNNDELFAKAPFSVIAAGMKAVEGLGHLRGGGNGSTGVGELPGAHSTNVNIGVVNISAEQKSDLMSGLDKLQQIKSLQALKSGTDG